MSLAVRFKLWSEVVRVIPHADCQSLFQMTGMNSCSSDRPACHAVFQIMSFIRPRNDSVDDFGSRGLLRLSPQVPVDGERLEILLAPTTQH